MKKGSKIPTFFGVLLLILGVGAGVLLVNREQIFKLGASPQASPKEVKITNVTSTSFSVSWITDQETKGFLKWGETATVGKTVQDTTLASVHSVQVTGLSPNRSYYFKINSQGQDYDNGGSPWNVVTAGQASSVDTVRISGVIQNENGETVPALIYISGVGFDTQSTISSTSGNWTMSLLLPKTFDKETSPLNIYVQGGARGVSTGQIFVKDANPVPTMEFGKTYDFKDVNTSNSLDSNDLNAVISLPDTSTENEQSRFDTTQKTTSTTLEPVVIKSISEGETVFTDKPAITGSGPKNTSITVTIHSDEAIVQQLKVPSNGQWSFTPPKNLSPGEHTVTVSWKDSAGILRTISKTFIVEVNAQEPSFESTPSGSTPTPTPTPGPTTQPTVTPSPVPTKTAKPTVVPTPTLTATDSALPSAGVGGFTLGLLFIGSMFIIGSVIVNKYA